jgi:hypothetical protein
MDGSVEGSIHELHARIDAGGTHQCKDSPNELVSSVALDSRYRPVGRKKFFVVDLSSCPSSL